jgi:hypothetical protein
MTTLSVVADCQWPENGEVGLTRTRTRTWGSSRCPRPAPTQITVQIRNVLDRAWEFIAQA